MPTLAAYQQQSAQGGGSAPAAKPQDRAQNMTVSNEKDTSPLGQLNAIGAQYQGTQPQSGACPTCGQAPAADLGAAAGGMA